MNHHMLKSFISITSKKKITALKSKARRKTSLIKTMNVNYKISSVLLLHFIMPKRKNSFLLVNSSPPAQTGSPWIWVYYSSPKRERRANPISQSSDRESPQKCWSNCRYMKWANWSIEEKWGSFFLF